MGNGVKSKGTNLGQLSRPSTSSKKYPENRFPECLFFKLKKREEILDRANILLTINFNEQKRDYVLGSVFFGLSGGNLYFKIKNGTIPYEYRVLKGSMDKFIKTKRVIESSGLSKVHQEKSTSGSLGIRDTGGAISIEGKTKKSKGQENAKRREDEFDYTKYQITTKGSEDKPIWNFKCETGENILKGTIVDEILGGLFIQRKPCFVDAIFIATQRDICITYAQNFWSKNITNNKKSIIKLIIRKRIMKEIKPYLSRDQISYE